MSTTAMRAGAFTGLALVILSGLVVPAHLPAHHVFQTKHVEAHAQTLAGHSERDTSTHVDGIAGTQTLNCPGCLLQTQLGGAHLLRQFKLAVLQPVKSAGATSEASPLQQAFQPAGARAPPSC